MRISFLPPLRVAAQEIADCDDKAHLLRMPNVLMRQSIRRRWGGRAAGTTKPGFEKIFLPASLIFSNWYYKVGRKSMR
jgi:hypothetical protein